VSEKVEFSCAKPDTCLLMSVEQFAGRLTKGRVVILPVQAVTENIFWTVRPWCIVNFSFFNCDFTYLQFRLFIRQSSQPITWQMTKI